MDAEKVLSDDRLAFAEIAQSIASNQQMYPTTAANAKLADIKKQCEDRVTAIDAALQDV